jgi:hypothetical protein
MRILLHGSGSGFPAISICAKPDSCPITLGKIRGQ